jgi:alpha-beta hydrolase superfamily lysophospholipase
MVHMPAEMVAGTPVIVICHGFTGDKVGTNQMNVGLANELETAGYAVVRFDYLGSGDSDGDFASDTVVSGWQEDLRNVVAWVRRQKEFSGNPLVLYGHSLGGLIVLTYKDPKGEVSARIVFAPVIDAVGNLRTRLIGTDLWQKSFRGETIANFYGKAFSLKPQFVRDLVANHYDPLGDAAALKTPLLVIHGTADVAVPMEGSDVLFERYTGPKELKILDIDHVAAGRHDLWIAAIIEWLERIFPR